MMVPDPARPRSGRADRVRLRSTARLDVADLIIVTAAYDDKAGLWTATSADAGAFFLQTSTWKLLLEQIPDQIAKSLPRRFFSPARDIFIEVVAHASIRYSPNFTPLTLVPKCA